MRIGVARSRSGTLEAREWAREPLRCSSRSPSQPAPTQLLRSDTSVPASPNDSDQCAALDGDAAGPSGRAEWGREGGAPASMDDPAGGMMAAMSDENSSGGGGRRGLLYTRS